MIAGLPDIDLKDAKPGLSIEEMREQCEEVLTPGDRKLLFYFFLHFDCVNLVKLLKNPEADRLSRVFSNTTVQKHQFFSTQLSV